MPETIEIDPDDGMRTTSETNVYVSDADLNSGSVRIQVTSSRLSEPNSFLSFKMTKEGLVIDHVDEHGNIIKSFSNMWDELEELLQ